MLTQAQSVFGWCDYRHARILPGTQERLQLLVASWVGARLCLIRPAAATRQRVWGAENIHEPLLLTLLRLVEDDTAALLKQNGFATFAAKPLEQF